MAILSCAFAISSPVATALEERSIDPLVWNRLLRRCCFAGAGHDFKMAAVDADTWPEAVHELLLDATANNPAVSVARERAGGDNMLFG